MSKRCSVILWLLSQWDICDRVKKLKKKNTHICSVRNMGLWDSCPIKIIWKKRLNFASSHNDKDVSNWVFGERPKNYIFLFGTLGQLSQLEIFGSKKSNFGQIYPSWPNHLCLFNHPSTQWLEKSKNWVLFWCGLGILLGVQKKPKTRFFNFQVQFWEPSHQLRWIHDTSKKTSNLPLSENTPKLLSIPTHARVIPLPKGLKCSWTVCILTDTKSGLYCILMLYPKL